MNTCRYWCLLMVLCILGCKSSDDGPADQNNTLGKEVNYTVLFERNDQLSGVRFQADRLGISNEPLENLFEGIPLPEAQVRDEDVVSYYSTRQDCSGELTQFSAKTTDLTSFSVFSDSPDCELEVISLSHTENTLFLFYGIAGQGLKKRDYFVRGISASGGTLIFPDIPLEKKPLQGIYAGNRLFILSQNPEGNTFVLKVVNAGTGEFINEINLNSGAQKIFKTSEGNIMVSYPDFHIIVDRGTLGIISTVRYLAGREPNFGTAEREFFDVSGSLYYAMETSLSGTTYPRIPGVYDFSRNTAILYYYENFLSETDRKFKYEIEDTTVVSYDSANDLILIGYRKTGNNGTGGLLRIKPAPEPAFIDNTDLEGVPQLIFTKQ